MNHAERYEYLTTKLSSMRWRGGELDCSYQAALYLMASHPALAEKVERYFSPDGIDFGGLMKKEEFDYAIKLIQGESVAMTEKTRI